LGFPIGEKSGVVRIPQVILEDRNSWLSYIRGVFDTDGSIYLRSSGKASAYRSPVIDIFSKSEEHVLQIRYIAKELGFNFWVEGKGHKIRMGGWGNTERFFKFIKPHNNRKQERFREIEAGMAERSKAQTNKGN
jgi:intein/homing endonuclease